jgi:hypothetical protein
MATYQLSYDVKDCSKTDNNEFRKKIVKSIIDDFKPYWMHRPVASTIIFACSNEMSFVGPKIEELMGKESFYILTETIIDKANKILMVWAPDSELEKAFKEEYEQLKRTK